MVLWDIMKQIYIEDEVHQKLKELAVKLKIPMYEVVRNMLRNKK